MSSHSSPETGGRRRPLAFMHLLESGDGFAHYLVATLLLLLALAILVASTIEFVSGLIQHPTTEGFAESGLAYLSNLLFGVIVLELLSTIITYIQARTLEATIKDFLIVGLISSIRKILLVGAQSSLEKSTGDDFVKEAYGTGISIVGILLLIGGLIALDRFFSAKKDAQPSNP